MFLPGQLVVYPAQGVGKIEAIESREVSGSKVELYIVSILGANITLMVPVSNTANVGLRPLCTAEYGQEVLESFKIRSGVSGYTGQNWNRRYREYSERLKTGQLTDAAHVLKELLLLGGEKELSFGERRLLEQAMHLITIEIACVLDKTQDEIKAYIEELFVDILHPQEKEG